MSGSNHPEEAQGQLDMIAYNVAHDALRGLESHEDICSLRYEGIAKAMEESKEQIKGIYSRLWMIAGTLILILLGITAWQYQQNEQNRDKFEQTVIKILREGAAK